MLAGADGLMRLIVETERDIVLNAIVGAAGLGPTVAALGEGIDLALANKERLVVGGELVMQLAEAHRRAAAPGRLRALGAATSCSRGERPGNGRPAGPDRLRRPVPRPHASDLAERQRRARRSRIRPGRWAARSRSTRRR